MKQNSIYLFKGLVLSALLLSALTLLLAFIMQQTQWTDTTMLPLLIVAFCLSTFLGSFAFSKHAPKRRFLWGIGFGIAFFAVYLAIAFCISPAAKMDTNRILCFLAASLASGCIGGMLS